MGSKRELRKLLAHQQTQMYRSRIEEKAGLENSRHCPHCQMLIPRTASVCGHCQRESPPWVFHNKVWWTKDEQGNDWWLDKKTNEWKPYVAQ